MNKNEETLSTWNKVADLYQEKFMHLELYNEGYDSFCRQLSKNNSSVLDVGCGPGNITRYLLARRPDLQVYGIDYSESMVSLARQNNPAANFDVMDCRNLNEIQQNFDGIICGFCIPYLSPEESIKFIMDCSQLLNDDGSLYISFVAGEPSASGYLTASTGDRTFFYFHTQNFLEQALHDNAFHLFQVFEVEYQKADGSTEVHTVLTAKKNIPAE